MNTILRQRIYELVSDPFALCGLALIFLPIFVKNALRAEPYEWAEIERRVWNDIQVYVYASIAIEIGRSIFPPKSKDDTKIQKVAVATLKTNMREIKDHEYSTQGSYNGDAFDAFRRAYTHRFVFWISDRFRGALLIAMAVAIVLLVFSPAQGGPSQKTVPLEGNVVPSAVHVNEPIKGTKERPQPSRNFVKSDKKTIVGTGLVVFVLGSLIFMIFSCVIWADKISRTIRVIENSIDYPAFGESISKTDDEPLRIVYITLGRSH